jgi:hypothetical protein
MWQRLLLASSLLFGLLVGVAATVFAYSNKATVDVGWSVFHLYGVPLWTVAVVPVAIVLVAGTLYHWYRSLYHFTEHMRHRRRVHELEAELTRLHAQLDQLLEMPDHGAPSLPVKHIDAEPAISKALPEPVASNGEGQPDRKTSARKRVSLTPAEAGRHEAGLNGLTQKEPSPAAVQEP